MPHASAIPVVVNMTPPGQSNVGQQPMAIPFSAVDPQVGHFASYSGRLAAK